MLGQIRDEMMNDFESRRITLNPDFSQSDAQNFVNQNLDLGVDPEDEYPTSAGWQTDNALNPIDII